jgi:hypothetical protein
MHNKLSYSSNDHPRKRLVGSKAIRLSIDFILTAVKSTLLTIRKVLADQNRILVKNNIYHNTR